MDFSPLKIVGKALIPLEAHSFLLDSSAQSTKVEHISRLGGGWGKQLRYGCSGVCQSLDGVVAVRAPVGTIDSDVRMGAFAHS